MLLSKSDFQLASSCTKKLVYKKKNYPSSNDTNEYMEMLAQGGYVVGKMATLLYPNGIEIEGSTDSAARQTARLLEEDNTCLFEATFVSKSKTCRVDILQKFTDEIHIIEVKSKSFDTSYSSEENIKNLTSYIEDVAFQYLVVSELYPQHQIKCYLLMPDKAKRTEIDALAGWFNLILPNDSSEATEEIITQQTPKFKKPIVEFIYDKDPNRAFYINQLAEQGILEYLDVTTKVESIQCEIKQRADLYIKILTKGIGNNDYSISKDCKSCEFFVDDAEPNGFAECWNGLISMPSILDLYKGGTIRSQTKHQFYLNELIAEGIFNFEDLDVERFRNAKGELGSNGIRQLIQYKNTLQNTEWISDELKHIIHNIEYPLHFIDFETYTGAVPFHKHMRPYEMLAFQWSCHTVVSPGAAPIHKEWISDTSDFPNFKFAEMLMDTIGDSGTPLMWATHENTVLRAIYYQMDEYNYKNIKLKKWLERIIKDSELGLEGRLVNMDRLTIDHYFHPKMKGRTSIKKVLPAVWNENDSLHEIPYFKTYSVEKFQNYDRDPYDTLAQFHGLEDDEISNVGNGTDAMRAYFRICFDNTLSASQKVELKNRLLEYCKLDTMAMLIIWMHWQSKSINN